MGFSNILGEAEIHSIPKIWEKWILIVREKFAKVQIFQIEGFLHVWYEAEIYLVPKAWEKWISIVQEKYEKQQTFYIYEFVKYFGWSRNPCNSRNMGKVNLHSTEKVWENTKISHILRYLADLELKRTLAIPNIWECTNSRKMEIFCVKPYLNQAEGFWGN